jgi:hypothetical protein
MSDFHASADTEINGKVERDITFTLLLGIYLHLYLVPVPLSMEFSLFRCYS